MKRFRAVEKADSSEQARDPSGYSLVADKFHVLRLLTPAINRHRKAITGDQRTNPVRRLLLRNGRDLDASSRWALRTWLAEHPTLRALYAAKEALSSFYRIRSFEQASRVLTKMTLLSVGSGRNFREVGMTG